ncbi:MAG: hypothetical protein ACE5FT_04850 [Candidatus Nanoarchaeia archaeon]
MTNLEIIVEHPTRDTTSGKEKSLTLYLGELALGTKASDERVLQGLAYFIEANGLSEEIGHVMLNGGLLPYIPTFYGVQNAREMMFLGNDWDREIDDRTKITLDKVNEKDRRFIEEWVANKITNTSQAVNTSTRAMAPLASTLDEAVWHYLHGEEDVKNTEALIEIKINDYVAKAKAAEEDKKRAESLQFEIGQLQGGISEKQKEYDLLRAARNGVHHTKKKEDVKAYIGTYLTEHAPDIDGLEDPDKFKSLISKSTSRSHLTAKLQSLDRVIKDTRKRLREKRRELQDAEHALNAQARVREASQFFRITKRQHIKPDQAEMFRYEAKSEYNENLYAIFPGLQFHVHSGNEVDLSVDGVIVNFAHKPNISTNAAGLADLKKTKSKNKSLGRNGYEVADVSVTAHGSGGFRMEVQPKKPETIENKVERETPEINMVMQLPTLQSGDSLRVASHKNIKNVHTQRYQKGNFSSGAVFYRVLDSGEHEVTMVPHETLLQMYEAGTALENLRSGYKEAGKKEKRTLAQKIVSLENEMRIDPVKGTVFTDIHFGCPNKEGRPSNYEVFESAVQYVRREGLPEVLVINGDILHGCLERHFGSNEQYYADGPADIERRIQEIESSKLSAKEKRSALARLAKRDVSHMIPLTSVSRQLREVKRRLVPLMHDILDNDGYVIVTSGNHYNETSKFFDEATDIVNLLDLKHLDNPKLVPFTSFGDKYAMGQKTLENDVVLYCSHGPMRGSDNVVGALRQVHGSYKNAQIAIYGHVHHAGGGHAEGTFALIGAAMQPWNSYVDRVGLEPGQRGIVSFAFDRAGKPYFQWKFILDKALEDNEIQT